VRAREELAWGGFLDRRETIRLLLAGWKRVLIGVLGGAFAGALLVMFLKPTYTATASFLPPGSMSSNSPRRSWARSAPCRLREAAGRHWARWPASKTRG
jgi:uncharacterized protein involved in exopolysaccharide biosynthesis